MPGGVELIAIQYPGREDRIGEPLVDDMDILVAEIAADLAPFTDRPYVVFGHSMGSSVAFETICAMREQGTPLPERLVVSGRRAPDRFLGGDVHRQGTEGLRRELDRLGGTPQEVLADPEMAAVVLQYVGNDYRLIERHHPVARPPLDCPVTVVLAADDPELGAEHAGDWHALAQGGDVVELPGNHFYLVPHRDQLLAAITARMDPALVRAAAAGP